MASTFNKNADTDDGHEEQPPEEMSMENEDDVQDMDSEMGGQPPMGGM